MTAFLLTALIGLVAYELKAWFPRITVMLTRLAASQLPRRERARYQEEWCALINDTPGALAKLWHCAGFFFGARAMFPYWKHRVARVRKRRTGRLRARVAWRFADVTVAGLALFASAPLLLITALCIKLESKGPVFFVSQRRGRGGRSFPIIKFRTMLVDGMSDGSNLTITGEFCRKHALDELPTLINVLRGDMSLVGPRPTLPNVEPSNNAEKPGITGLQQLGMPLEKAPHGAISALKTYFRLLLMTIRALLNRDGGG